MFADLGDYRKIFAADSPVNSVKNLFGDRVLIAFLLLAALTLGSSGSQENSGENHR